ncbi:MAG: glycerophosphoryl diester phosphodiesterase [Solirubrobacteraceae bacterium]|nr:glycerophosphoryl diester phosphodiesterase [Solirubrobacteraceae bacterium]
MKRVGHKGAHHIAPGNTLASFDAALEAGVDMIEFDVLAEHRDGSGRLLLAHDYGDARRPDVIELADGLAHLRSAPYAGIELDVDLKIVGCEERVLAELRAQGLLDRTLISSMELESLRTIRALDPQVRIGLSIPKLRRDLLASRWTRYPTYLAAAAARRLIPIRAARAIRAGHFDALMCHWALVTPRLARAVAGAGGELYVWTVDEGPRIATLEAMGVAGVISNDPRLFAPQPARV